MKGYFGIGIEGASKAVNVGTLFRTAHAFGASFVFTVRAQYNPRQGSASDTSDTRVSRLCAFQSFQNDRCNSMG